MDHLGKMASALQAPLKNDIHFFALKNVDFNQNEANDQK
jgi:hypothetical protein